MILKLLFEWISSWIKPFGPDLTPYKDVCVYFCVLHYWGMSILVGIVFFSCYASVFHTPPLSLTSGWRLTCFIGWTRLAPTTKAVSITMTRTPPLAPGTPVHTDMELMSIMTIIRLSQIEAWFEASLGFNLTDLFLHSTLLNLEFAVSFTATACGLFFLYIMLEIWWFSSPQIAVNKQELCRDLLPVNSPYKTHKYIIHKIFY